MKTIKLVFVGALGFATLLNLIACSVPTKFASNDSVSCVPSSASARYGQNPGPVIVSPTPDTPFNTNMPVSGTCANGFQVVISGPGLAQSVTTSCTSGNFSTTVQLSGPDGQKLLQAAQATLNGQDITDAVCVDRLTVPPKVVITRGPGDNGTQAIDTTTNVVNGTCKAGLTVVITSPDLANTISAACPSGTFTTTLTLTGPDGPKPITATQTDPAGNVGDDSATFLIDTTAPIITIAAPTTGTLTNHPIAISGTCETGLSVIIQGTGEAGVQSVSCTNGTYSTPLVFSAGDGAKNLVASQTDLAGNTGKATTTVTLDTIAPVVTITAPAANAFVGLTGTITGTCETGLNVSVAGSGITTPQTVSCVSAAYTANVTYSANDGSKIVTASQTDLAGNTGSTTKTYIKDTINPVVTINTPAANAYVPATVAITGNCESGFNVILSGAGIVAPVTAACTSGAYTGNVTFSSGDGNKVVVATETDAGGLSGTATRTFVRDTTAPTLTITAPTANTYVGANTVLVTGTCSEAGTVVVAGTGVVAPQNATCTGSTFSTTVTFTAGDGSKQITASETDPAGNTGTTNVTVIKDTTAPVVVITTPLNNAYVAATSAIQGTCETGLTVSIAGSGVSAPQMAACTAGAFTTNVTFTSADGAKVVTASQTDLAGNVGTDTKNYVKDTTVPVVTITTPAANAYVPASVAIIGTCESGFNVVVAGTGVLAPVTSACTSNAYSATVTFTAGDGNKQVTATETDAAGLTGSAAQTYIRDTTAPVVTIIAPAANAFVSTTANVQGACETGENVTVAGSGVQTPMTAACTSSAYSTTVTFTAGDGSKIITASETDAAGNTGTATRTVNKDTTLPVVTITSPAALTYVPATTAILGTCEAGFNVIVAGTGVVTPQTSACPSGTFSANVTFTAGDGSKQVTATETDAAGLTGSTTQTYVRDTTPPLVTIVTPANNAYVGATPTIQGTCETGENVTVAGSGVQTPIIVACTSGAFSTPVTLTAGDGAKQVVASETDAAGNVGSDTKNYIKDTTAPVVAITSPANNAYVPAATNIMGTCESGFNVVIAGSGITAPTTVACIGGAFSGAVTFTAGDGSKAVTATETDLGGLSGSDSKTYLRDTTAPLVAITSPAANTATNGNLNVGGTCEVGLNVVLAGTGVTTPITTMCTAMGTFTGLVTLLAPDGTKNVTATQTDLAGNIGSDNRNFILLSTAPTVAITSPAANTSAQTGLTVSGTCETGLNVVIAGTGASAPVTVMCTASAFSSPIVFSAGDGTKNITATQTDAAGNIGSDNRNFIKDTTAPLVAITAPAANTATHSTITVSGTCETGLNVTLAGTGVTAPVTAACASGAFSGVVTLVAPDGTKNVTATQTDLAGNVGSDNRNFVLLTTAPAVAITAPAANTAAQNGLTVSGTCQTGLNVVLAGTGASAPVTVACNAGAFSGAIVFSAGDGTKNITATQTDIVGDVGSDNRNFIKDTTAPLVAITAPVANTYIVSTVTISGTCETGLNVILAGAGAAAPVTTTCAAGTFSAAVSVTSGDGTKNFTATQTDLAGNIGSDNRTFIKDTTAPLIAITSPAANTNAQTGLTVGGTCETGLNVTLAGTGVSSPVVVSCSAGVFTGAIVFTAGDGTKNVTATQTDLAGNIGSDNRNFVKDTTAPVIAITGPAAGTAAQTGVTLTGTCQAGLTVNLSGTGLLSPSTTTCASGTFSVAITFSSGDGNKNIVVAQTDAAGNTGTDNRTFIKDTTAPLVAITAPAANTVAQNSISVSGTCETGLNVVLAGSGVSTPVTTPCGASTFSAVVTFNAPDGSKLVTATQTDAAGNIGSDSRTFIRDTTAPLVAITSPAANTSAKTGVTLTGTCETGLTVVLGGSGLQSPTSTTCTASAFSVAITFTSGDGSKLITASQTDAAGNTGSDSRTFIKDTTAPLIAITSPTNGSTVPASITLVGTCETGLTVSIAGDLTTPATTSCAAGAFSAAINLTTANGSKNVTASQTDAAGNTGTASATYTVAGNVGNDTFTSKGPGGVVDIIFSDDNSASMINDQTTLAGKFQNFTADLAGTNWQIGVVTSDCTAGSPYNFCGQLQPMVGAPSGQYVLTPTTPNFVTVFENTIIRPEANPNCIATNTCASGNSQLLQPVAKAFTLANTTNTGFFRANADLAVIAISNGHTGYATLPGYTAPATFETDFTTSFGGTGKRLIGYGIIIQPNDTTCLASEQAGLGGGTAAYAQDIFDLAAQTGGTTVSICAADYSVTLANIAASVVNLGNSYTLAHTPIAGTVSVVFTPAATSPFTVTGNVITFSPPPPLGTQINITYQY